MPERADRLGAVAREEGLDAVLVTEATNVRYVTGFTGSSGLALVGANLRRFVTDFRYLTQSAEQLDGEWSREIAPDLLEQLVARLPDTAFRLGFDDAHLSVKQHARLAGLLPDTVELVPAGGLVEDLRLVKDAAELERIRAAQRLADAALEDVLQRGLAGRTEQAVALDLEMTMRRLGAQGSSFPPIVAAGGHGALPHAEPRDVVIPEGTLCVIDWGCMLDGYASDCTRTYATSADVDPRDLEVYATVLKAQRAAVEAVRPGPLGKDVDAVAREVIDAAGHAEHFGHGLGHGVGMEVHEGPRLSRQGEVALAPGHVVTVEPGIYVPSQVGVRIEDLVVVTEDGHEVLTSLTKELVTAPRA
ncbi:MAG: aminopeptidase family protein [Solirubrobacterales bacterium]|jgi:Xaa-Pro aminopeptidase|nr:aminopeptidase family protein [Solirubrobacterales bacterium]